MLIHIIGWVTITALIYGAGFLHGRRTSEPPVVYPERRNFKK